MGIKQKLGPLQPKNVNTLILNKTNTILDSKSGNTKGNKSERMIEILQDKINSMVDYEQSRIWDGIDSSKLTIPEEFKEDHNIVIDSHNNNNANSFNFFRNFNSMSLMSEILQEGGVNTHDYQEIVNCRDPLQWCDDKYVTKISQYTKRSIDYSLSILQEKSLETEEKVNSPDSISTPLNITSNAQYCSDDINMIMDVFNSSQLGNFPIILPPPMVVDHSVEMMEEDESLSEFYHSFGGIPETHYMISYPLQIVQPVPVKDTQSLMIPYQTTLNSVSRKYPPISTQVCESSIHNNTSNMAIQSSFYSEDNPMLLSPPPSLLPGLEPDL